MPHEDAKTFRRRLDEFSQRLRARTAEFKDSGAFSDVHQATLRDIERRHERLVERVSEAQRQGMTWRMIEGECWRDFMSLFDDFVEWEDRADAETMRSSR
jgi:hypothetical protein